MYLIMLHPFSFHPIFSILLLYKQMSDIFKTEFWVSKFINKSLSTVIILISDCVKSYMCSWIFRFVCLFFQIVIELPY